MSKEADALKAYNEWRVSSHQFELTGEERRRFLAGFRAGYTTAYDTQEFMWLEGFEYGTSQGNKDLFDGV